MLLCGASARPVQAARAALFGSGLSFLRAASCLLRSTRSFSIFFVSAGLHQRLSWPPRGLPAGR
eukprot:4709708-Prymnesium_polylepis.1